MTLYLAATLGGGPELDDLLAALSDTEHPIGRRPGIGIRAPVTAATSAWPGTMSSNCPTSEEFRVTA